MSIIRKYYGFSEEIDVIWQFDSDKELKLHAGYKNAKRGDLDSALSLVFDLKDETVVDKAKKCFIRKADFLLPIIAEEIHGDNAIPLALAALYSEMLDLPIVSNIFQITKAYHTGADPMERILSRVIFEGSVKEGTRYIIVDDVSTMGTTLADLASYIKEHGGVVVGVILLSNCSRSKKVKPPKRNINLIKERFENEIRELFSIEPDALTYDEAIYLSGFNRVEQLRVRAVKAENERKVRIASKIKTKCQN